MEFTRPFNEVELGFLQQDDEADIKRIKQYKRWRLIWPLVVVGSGVIIGFFIATKLLPVLALVFSLLLGISYWSLYELLREARKNLSNREKLRKENKAEVLRLTVTGYIYFPEEEDEGDGFIFQLPDNRLMAFSGVNFNKDETWPVTQFDIVRWKEANGWWMSYIIPLEGAALMEPTYVLENIGGWFNGKYRLLSDANTFFMIEGSLEDCLEIIRRGNEKGNQDR